MKSIAHFMRLKKINSTRSLYIAVNSSVLALLLMPNSAYAFMPDPFKLDLSLYSASKIVFLIVCIALNFFVGPTVIKGISVSILQLSKGFSWKAAFELYFHMVMGLLWGALLGGSVWGIYSFLFHIFRFVF